MYKILIFDLDDTLIDNKENTRAAFATMLSSANGQIYTETLFKQWYALDKQFWIDWQDGLIALPEVLIQEKGKKSDKFLDWLRSQRILMYFENSVTIERAIELNNIYMQALNDVVVPIDGAQGTLKYLSSKYKLLVATNGPNIATQKKLEKIRCLDYISEVLSADMFGYMKPKIEFFTAIEEKYNDFSISDYLIIGDSLKSDIGFGVNAGIDSCWFNRNNEGLDAKYKPTYIINNLEELKYLL